MKMTGLMSLVSVVVFVAMACSSEGDNKGSPQKPPSQPETEPPPVLPLQPLIPFKSLAYQDLPEVKCFNKAIDNTIPPLVGGFVLDGQVGEFLAVTPQLDDPNEGSSPDGQRVWLQRSPDGFFVIAAVGTFSTAAAEWHLTFGGVRTLPQELVQEAMHELRFIPTGGAEIRLGGEWRSLPEGDLQWSATATGIEIKVAERVIAGALHSPMWWLQMATASDQGVDHFAPFYSPNYFGHDRPRFEMQGCRRWTSKRSQMTMHYAIDRELWRDLALETNPQLELVKQASWVAVEDVMAAMGQDFSWGHFTLVLSDKPEVFSPKRELLGEADLRRRALYVDLSPFRSWSSESFPVSRVYHQVADRLIDLISRQSLNTATGGLMRTLMRRVLLQKLSKHRFGVAFSFDHQVALTEPLLVAIEDDVVGLLDRMAVEDYGTVTRATLNGLAFLLENWVDQATVVETLTTPYDTMESLLAMLAARTSRPLSRLLSGWWQSGPYEEGFGLGQLQDADGDGIVLAVETILQTDPTSADTDGDGWSDYAEVVLGDDPLNLSSNPKVVVADGNFDDWIDLIPARLGIDEGREERCVKSSDVTHYGAIANRNQMIVGAVSAEFWQADPQASWRVFLDFPVENRQFELRVVTGSGFVELFEVEGEQPLKTYYRAFAVGQTTLEWVFDREILGLERDFNDTADALVKFRTVYRQEGEDIYCDETDWFAPQFVD